MTNRASVRREVRIAAPADRVWDIVGDSEPGLLLEAPVEPFSDQDPAMTIR